ncbi:MAG: hypothetical protein QM800_04270 [Paludibacter sp.]
MEKANTNSILTIFLLSFFLLFSTVDCYSKPSKQEQLNMAKPVSRSPYSEDDILRDQVQGQLQSNTREYIGNAELGQSVYDKKITQYSETLDLPETRANIQSRNESTTGFLIICVIIGFAVVIIIIGPSISTSGAEQETSIKDEIYIKYKLLIDYLMASSSSRITKHTKDTIVICSTTTTFTISFIGGQTEIIMNALLPLVGQISNKWRFPSEYSQERIIEEIDDYIGRKMVEFQKQVNCNTK